MPLVCVQRQSAVTTPPPEEVTITFDSAGGSSVASITQAPGTSVTAPANPTRTGYTFSAWDPVVPSVMPAADITCVAQWTVNQYTITFNSDGGSAVSPITQDYGTAVTAPSNPTRTGYTFSGWSPAVPSTMPASNTTCVAQWTVNQYTITFNSNGGSAVSSITQAYGTSVTAPANPTRSGYTFSGWSPAVPSTMPASNTTCVAQWAPIQTITLTVTKQFSPANTYLIHGTASAPTGISSVTWAYSGWTPSNSGTATVSPAGGTDVTFNGGTHTFSAGGATNVTATAYITGGGTMSDTKSVYVDSGL